MRESVVEMALPFQVRLSVFGETGVMLYKWICRRDRK